jgi:hypothetical protein
MKGMKNNLKKPWKTSVREKTEDGVKFRLQVERRKLQVTITINMMKEESHKIMEEV